MSPEEVAKWVRHNSIVNGSVTREQAEHIDWVALVTNSKLWKD